MAKRREAIPAGEAESLVEGLSHQDRIRILANLLWDVFGDVDEAGETWLLPGRSPDKVDTLSLTESLRQEFWPEEDDEEDDDGEEETE